MAQEVTFAINTNSHPEGAHLLEVSGKVMVDGVITHIHAITTRNTVEEVMDLKERIADEIETWAVDNTDYRPHSIQAA